MSNLHPSVIFLRVTDNNTKIRRIVSTVQQHFLSGDKLIVFVPSQQAADYLDNLLWKTPQESFLPHAVAEEKSQERVVITASPANLNNAKVALNLSSGICADLQSFETIYELWDQTDEKKMQLSRSKQEKYQNLGLLS